MSNQTLIERNIELKKRLNDKKNPVGNLAEFAEEYGISRNRLYQIKKSKETMCKKHGIYFYTSCVFCKRESQKKDRAKNLKSIFNAQPDLLIEIKVASKHDRTSDAVEHRTQLVKQLIDVYGLKSTEIGKLIKRAHSTVLSIYSK